jgi:diguanylate cyclase (GGDEF)-like protein
VLRDVTRVVTTCLAGGGLLARVGGEEFAVLVPVGVDGARYVAERLRTAIEATKFSFEQREIPVTISLGVAELAAAETPAKLYERADTLLYQSKHDGRNRVSG